MLFNSWVFIEFLIVVFSAYYLLPLLKIRYIYQVFLLLFSSLIFYGYKDPYLIFLLLLSLLLNSFVSNIILKEKNKGRNGYYWLFLAVTINILILAIFKYLNLIASLIFNDEVYKDFLSIPLPIGISFYTFQAISLVVDMYKQGNVKINQLENDFNENKIITGYIKIFFYISFFPQLVAGPIVKAHDFFNQIEVKYFKDIDWDFVVKNLIMGFFLKMVVADNLKDVTYLLYDGKLSHLGKLDLIVLLYGYSFQIFSDFCGYSLIAIGLGELFGYRFPINFNYPYISKSITEFWRRWHISLSSFLREYLYIPLGGNRKGKIRTYINLFIVMFLGGLWHGASWSYAIWGTSHGLMLAIEKLYSDYKVSNPVNSHISNFIKVVITFHVVSLLWLLFIMPEFSMVVDYFYYLFNQNKLITMPENVYIVFVYGLPILIYHLLAYLEEESIINRIVTNESKYVYLSLMLSLIVLNSGTSGEFIYFQF